MPRIHLYADESGNFDFSRRPRASRYFILTTITLNDHAICAELLELRRDLAWRDVDVHSDFHAAEDRQAIRDAVFALLGQHDFRIDATIIDKPKAHPRTRASDERFYQYAWFYHMRHLAPILADENHELLVVAASLGPKKRRLAFSRAVRNPISRSRVRTDCHTACWPAATDPALQVADYCSWALQRKWERGDLRSYELIAAKIRTEFDLFRQSAVIHY